MNEISKPAEAPTASALASPLPSKHTFKPLKECRTLEEAFNTHEFMERIQASVPQHVQPGRMLRTFVSAVSKTPLLAQVSIRSFLGACLTCSQVGLEPNTPLGHIWLLPFKTKTRNPATGKRDLEIVEVNTIFGYPGLLDLSYRTVKVKSIHADVVWPGDEFSFEYGSDAHLRHRPRGHKADDRPLYAYMHAALDGGQAFETMPYEDVLAIRNKSQAYRYALAAKEEAASKSWNVPRTWTEAPWVAHEIAMARKTAFRAGSKWLPRSVELAAAIALDEAQDRRTRMDFSTVMDAPTIDGTPDYLGAATDSAMGSDEEAERGEPVRTGSTVQVNKAVGPTPEEIAANKARTVAEQKEASARATRERAEQKVREDASLAADAEAVRQATHDPASEETFEAVLISEHGEIMSGDFVTPVEFATAFVAHGRIVPADLRPAYDEHNADAIEAVLRDDAASAILAGLNVATKSVAPAIVVVEPPVERGKISWPSYVKLLKAALMQNVDAGNFGQWTAAQRETLEKCPMAQRVLAIRAISETAGMRRVDPPLWLGDLVRGKPAETQAKPTSGGKPERSVDERWVDARLKDIAEIADRLSFDQLVSSMAVKTVMARLRRENVPLFNVADAAFTLKHNELPPADPDDPGVGP
jgi:recombination protein RecT